MTNNITVIDALMGTGKSSWAIQWMKEHKEERIIYVTPYRDEIKRVRDAIGCKSYTPTNKGKGHRKIDDLKELLEKQANIIVCTHALFLMFNEEIKELILEGEYTIILDEVVDAMREYKSKRSQEYDEDDYEYDDDTDNFKVSLNRDMFSIDSDRYVHWTGFDLDALEVKHPYYREMRELALQHRLVSYNGRLIWMYPPEIFRECKQMYILTYMFEASIMRYYFDYKKIDYCRMSVDYINGAYMLVDYFRPDTSIFAPMINIVSNNDFRNNPHFDYKSLSSSWFDKAKNNSSRQAQLRTLKNNMRNLLMNRWKVKSSNSNVIWTTLKKAKNKITPRGYKDSFVSINLRATNNYRQARYIIYAVNINPNGIVKGFLASKGISIDSDSYALSEMLQFIWRTRIRDGESIDIYIPSPRMTKLLCCWLGVTCPDERLTNDIDKLTRKSLGH